MTRATRAVIDLGALRHNLQIAHHAAPNAKHMAIIKADAYGHGMVRAAQALDAADAFGVASLDEALLLRAAGIQQAISLLEGFTRPQDISLLREHKLDCVVHHASQVDMLAAAEGSAINVWLKIDTGMHRLGIAPAQATKVYQRLVACETVTNPFGLMTHLANADDRNDTSTETQIKTFYEAIEFTDTQDASEVQCSIANSAGILGWPTSHAQWVRPGIMLYGVSPFINSTAADYDLKPVMTLHSELIAVNVQRKGDWVGYGGLYICEEDMPIGVVAIGYGDGYPRHAKTGTPVLVNGQRTELAGRVSMDMITVDLRSQPHAKVGDAVVLWGEGLPVEEIAESAETIGYELLCGVTQRVDFEYQT